MTEHFGQMLGFIAAALSLASFMMKSMLPLRAFAMTSNVFFIMYGYVESLWPALLLHSALLPLNATRLWEIRKLSKEIARATHDSPVSQWLLPHMTRSAFKTEDVLFKQGEAADRLIYVASGQLRLAGVSQTIEAGELIGEIGLFSPEKKRTQTVIGNTDGELYWMSEEMIFRLYYQNPKIGFYLMRLVTERLLRDVRRQSNVMAATAA
jgi:CRP-like cAMP-binding protein